MNKSKIIIHNQKHLTLSDRTYIEQKLLQNSSFHSISATLHRDLQPFQKRFVDTLKKYIQNQTHYAAFANIIPTVILGEKKWTALALTTNIVLFTVKKVIERTQQIYALTFFLYLKRISKPPYVCNACLEQHSCPITHRIYIAAKAQKQYEKVLIKSRDGINMIKMNY